MTTRRRADGPEDTLQSISTMLDVASRLTERMASAPALRKLLRAWDAVPADDRPVLAEAITRESDARRLSHATEDVTGQSMVPNPNARLYLRVHETEVPRVPLEREEMTIAMIKAARVLALLDLPGIHQTWLAAAEDAFTALSDAERAMLERRLREAGDVLAGATVAARARKRHAAG